MYCLCMSSRYAGWWFWLILLAAVTYSPFVAPAGKFSPFILGMPYTLALWMVLTIILLVSVILFAKKVWRDV